MIHTFEYNWCIEHDFEPTLDAFNSLWQNKTAVTAFADQLGARTQELAKDEVRRSPFTVNAATAGFAHIGGKLDLIRIQFCDCTCNQILNIATIVTIFLTHINLSQETRKYIR